MLSEKTNAAAHGGASVSQGGGLLESANAEGFYSVECYDAEGNLKWSDTIENATCDEGVRYVLDKAFAGSGYNAAWYLGLYNAGTPAGTGTYATKGVTEDANYSNATRPAASWNAASTRSKGTAAAAFNINGTTTILGCFLVTNSTKSDSTASAGINVMYSVGAFSGGSKAVAAGDTLNVTYSTSL